MVCLLCDRSQASIILKALFCVLAIWYSLFMLYHDRLLLLDIVIYIYKKNPGALIMCCRNTQVGEGPELKVFANI